MKIIREDHPIGRGDVACVELTRWNLTALLAKLDEPDSLRTIEMDGVCVTAVENQEHYDDRAPGSMRCSGCRGTGRSLLSYTCQWCEGKGTDR